ncbi:MAG TPA: alpha/beta hydrolase, partial [Acetobacteraceae bacterium]|nr:alpha/beta hydrolase [Acetobacteraceae bacterium]
MIAIRTVLSTSPAALLRAFLTLLFAGVLLSGCDVPMQPDSRLLDKPPVTSGRFTMPDGFVLPYRAWLPDGAPRAVVLALHGMNDSRDAWEYPAPDFVNAGVAIYAPDQRGFGTTPDRGRWAGARVMASDARHMAEILRHRYPHTRLILMGESMGAAVLMVL